MRRRYLFAVVVAALLLVACSGGASEDSTGAGPASTPAPTAAGACAVGPQPAFDKIPADNATALAFAPDGRLFYAERSGTVSVYQDGTARVFAKVATMTSATSIGCQPTCSGGRGGGGAVRAKVRMRP